jgi:hypothetical protein
MDKVHTAYKVMEKSVKEDRDNTIAEKKELNNMIADIKLYIDTRLDILENKFLVFICNIGRNHWVSVVVVNPIIIFDKFLPEDNCEQSVKSKADDLCGWCLLNSLANSSGKEKMGFQGTVNTKNNASYGVHLFLDICVSYLKEKKSIEGEEKINEDQAINEGDEKQEVKFSYEEPFGFFMTNLGTEDFPQPFELSIP